MTRRMGNSLGGAKSGSGSGACSTRCPTVSQETVWAGPMCARARRGRSTGATCYVRDDPIRRATLRTSRPEGAPMSLDVPPKLLEQAERVNVDEAEFVDCVRTSLPYA